MPYGFPSGSDFVEIVSNDLKTKEPQQPHLFRLAGLRPQQDPWKAGFGGYDKAFKSVNPLVSLLGELGFDYAFRERFRASLVKSQLQSVDSFLERRPEYIELGKAAMAYSLLKHERTDLFKLRDHWYRYLWNRLDCPFEEFDNNRLSIVTYNYDRSLEHYLFEAMQHASGKSSKECIEKMSAIKFVHLHGSLGQLPWQNYQTSLAFGAAEVRSEVLRTMAGSMVVIHEGKDDSQEYAEAFELMSAASRIYFLGFGYGATNLRRLGLDRLVQPKEVIGTAMGLSPFAIQNILREQSNRLKLQPGLDCSAFLKEVRSIDN